MPQSPRECEECGDTCDVLEVNEKYILICRHCKNANNNRPIN